MEPAATRRHHDVTAPQTTKSMSVEHRLSKAPSRSTLPRHLFALVVATGLVVAAALVARLLESATLAAVFALGFGFLGAGALTSVMYRMAERDVGAAWSLVRVRQYGDRLAIYDKESGFFADWYFGLRLREEIARADRYGQPFTLLIVEDSRRDFAESKNLVVRCLKKQLRSMDMVAHLGDHRFAVLLANTPSQGAIATIGRLRDNLLLGHLHVGSASYPDDGPSVRSLLTAAGASTDVQSAIIRGTESVSLETAHSGEPLGDGGDGGPATDDPAIPSTAPQEPEGDPTEKVIEFPRAKMCSAPGCGRPHHARGLCSRHYAQARRKAA